MFLVVLKGVETDLYTECFNVVGAICTSSEVGQVELYLVPAVIQPHRHRADEGLNASCALVVAGTESPTYVLIIQYLYAASSPLTITLYSEVLIST